MINPYKDVNWETVDFISSVSHMHQTMKYFAGNAVMWGLRHFAPSNYHPSEPYYPLSDYFSDIPDWMIGSPNSEFYNMDIPFLHANALGSFASEPEPNNMYSWKYKFKNILSQMQYDDGGGITLNHPNWTKYAGENAGSSRILRNSDLMEMLDFDDRVLGIEFFNAGSVNATEHQWDLDTWDEILLTGRRCWGFCVPDHDGEAEGDLVGRYKFRGRNMLLVSEFTEHECLKAYREGRFYGSVHDTSLKFTSITYNNSALSVTTENADYINIVADGVYNRVDGNAVTYNIPNSTRYVRVEAHNDEDSIFSQPIIFRLKKHSKGTDKKMLLLN